MDTSSPPSAAASKGPLPLVLAVTGHRDLRPEDEPSLRQQVRAAFEELLSQFPFTPLRLLTGLAEGADRLAARLAADMGISLIACLPMERALYEKDFKTKPSRDEFAELINRANEVISLPLAPGNTREGIRRPGTRRNLQYQAHGEYLVRQCQILIALWDGRETNLVGGTSSVVRAQLGKKRTGYNFDPETPLDYPETGPVFQIVTPRKKNPSLAGPFRRKNLFHPGFDTEKAAEQSYRRIYRRMDLFNEDAVKVAPHLDGARAQSKDWLLPKEVRGRFHEPLTTIIDHYALADSLAIHYQNLTRKSLKRLIFGYGLGVVLMFEFFGHGHPQDFQILALVLYVVVIAIAWWIYFKAKSGEYKTRHLDYRALAEGLRLQIFWRLAGLDTEVADHYLRKQKTELDWIRNAIRVWHEMTASIPITPDLSVVKAHWVDDQARFFAKAAKRDHQHHENERQWTRVLLGVTLAIAVGAIICVSCIGKRYFDLSIPNPFASPHEAVGELEGFHVHGLVVIAMAMLLAYAGAIAAYSAKMAFNEQRKQYERMKSLFARGVECLGAALQKDDVALAQRIIQGLGDEALAENGDWVLLHREREVELRVGG